MVNILHQQTWISLKTVSERRLTSREVALVLRRAVELEEEALAETGNRGMTVQELQEVAREVGIDHDLVSKALIELESRRGLEPRSVFGPSGIKRDIRAVSHKLSREELKELIRIIDQNADNQGHVSEALGSVRWSASQRFLSSQVSLEPSDNETVIRVEERLADRLKYMLHFIPGSYTAIAAAMIAFGVGIPAIPAVLIGAVGGAAGFSLGGGIWRILSNRSARRVRSLIRKLTEEIQTEQKAIPEKTDS